MKKEKNYIINFLRWPQSGKHVGQWGRNRTTETEKETSLILYVFIACFNHDNDNYIRFLLQYMKKNKNFNIWKKLHQKLLHQTLKMQKR